VQLALDPLVAGEWDPQRTLEALRAGAIWPASGMMTTFGEDYTTPATIRETGGIRPDQHWPRNIVTAKKTAAMSRRCGLRLVTFHAGFLPEEHSDPERAKLVRRLHDVADIFADEGVSLGLETGQETPGTLLDVLAEIDHPSVGVNFDPANMILYDQGDPVAALALLSRHVRQVHIKDATASKVADQWGEEVPVGAGEVDWPRFLAAASKLGVPMMIEREAGTERIRDVQAARAVVENFQGSRS
jgi:sugar phosphate isomerase/epimerase